MIQQSDIHPPKWAERILLAVLSSKDRDMLLGDFEEFYEEKCEAQGKRCADLWYWRQAFKSIPHFISNYFFWRVHMFGNHAKLAMRNIKKHKGFSFINVCGLAMGLACCMIMMLYVAHEGSYDQYHEGAARIFRILEYRKVPVGEFVTARISTPVADILKSEYPEVEVAARFMPTYHVQVENDMFKGFEDQVFYVEPECLDLFSIQLISGNLETVLQNPSEILITERMAKKYFGNIHVIGAQLIIKDPRLERMGVEVNSNVFTVAGILKNPQSNTHIKYEILLPLMRFKEHWLFTEWHAGPVCTYVRLAPGTSKIVFDNEIKEIAYQFVGKDFKAWGQTREYYLQPLKDVHFESHSRELPIRGNLEVLGNRNFLVIYSIIALLILAIGCMNFINLSNARAVTRIKEVGLRKVIGARRSQLMSQFLGESIIITFVASSVSILIAQGLLPLFNEFAGTTLSLLGLFHPQVALTFALLIVVVGGLSGFYPAFVLTRFSPDQVLRGTTTGTRGASMLRVLVIGQFAISIFLAVGATAVHQQLGYLSSGELGFDMTYKYVIPYRMNAKVRKQTKLIQNEFFNVDGVMGVTASSSVPGRGLRRNALAKSESKTSGGPLINFLSCDDQFFTDYQIPIVAGRLFNEAMNDENRAFIINESAVKVLGYNSAEEAIGERYHESYFSRWKSIVGVVKNFYFQGLGREMEPMYMEVSSSRFDMLTLTLSSASLSTALKSIEEKWAALFPDIPFAGFFLNDDFGRLYRKETQMGKLLHILTAMGLISASLGLLGLTSFIVQHRMKEIGIRKTLGASIPILITLIARRFVWLVLAANALALPVSYLIVGKWLENYANRTTLDWQLFAIPGISALCLAIIPVAVRAYLAARVNPVETLRYE
ncbi:ABC transporter permease [bacterium]|nr:ABC transporter permease [bacterium]